MNLCHSCTVLQSMALKVSTPGSYSLRSSKTKTSSNHSTASAMSVKTSSLMSHPVGISSSVCDVSSEPPVVDSSIDSSSSSMSVDESSLLSQSVGISSSDCDNSSVSPVVDSTPGASTAVPSASKVSKNYMNKNRKNMHVPRGVLTHP